MSVQEKTPKLLIFQGSYINGKGQKFLAHAFREYIGVHDYQNLINFDYYYNIFKPQVVVIEVAEYACTKNYFNLEAMQAVRLNPVLDLVGKDIEYAYVHGGGLSVRSGKTLTQICWPSDSFESVRKAFPDSNRDYVWLLVDGQDFDMKSHSQGEYAYTCTIDNSVWQQGSDFQVYYQHGNDIIHVVMPVNYVWE